MFEDSNVPPCKNCGADSCVWSLNIGNECFWCFYERLDKKNKYKYNRIKAKEKKRVGREGHN